MNRGRVYWETWLVAAALAASSCTTAETFTAPSCRPTFALHYMRLRASGADVNISYSVEWRDSQPTYLALHNVGRNLTWHFISRSEVDPDRLNEVLEPTGCELKTRAFVKRNLELSNFYGETFEAWRVDADFHMLSRHPVTILVADVKR